MRSAVVPIGAALCALLVGCTGVRTPSPEPAPTATASTEAATGALHGSPIVFTLRCGGEVFTTYAAAWEARREHCTATRLAGDTPSAQQASAVAATDGAATLAALAGTCAETESAPWTGPITSDADASRGAGLLRYCPGHPAIEHLRDALAAYRG